MPELLLIDTFIFIFGLSIGSFLNVAIFRLHSGESITWGRSHCMACKKELLWYELVPLISFLLQGGRCRNCDAKISWQYPLVELSTGALFLLSFLLLSGIAYVPSAPSVPIRYPLFFLWVLCSLCIVIFVYDIRYLLIPDATIVWGSALFFLAGIISAWKVPIVGQFFMPHATLSLWAYLLLLIATVLLIALPFFIIVFFSQGDWMGFGDVKLAFFMGMVLGLHAFLAIFIGILSGAIIGIVLMALGKAGMKTHIPFGPFLVFGMLAVVFFGQALMNYMSGYGLPLLQ